MEKNKAISLGEKVLLRSDYGPVSFGMAMSASIVSWSGKGARDLLVSRCARGFFLYPSKALTDSELAGEPIHVCTRNVTVENYISPVGVRSYIEFAVPADWNRDGAEDIIAGGLEGFFCCFERSGQFPNISFQLVGLLEDKEKNLPFNLPYDNPNRPVLDNLGGYFDTAFASSATPARYPADDPNMIDLVVGDWAGNLWWMPDMSDGKAEPEYRGIAYTKPQEQIVSKSGRRLIQQFGCEYVRPEAKICDENGRPFLLGEGLDTGVNYHGCGTRPVPYRNDLTGSNDLLVFAGMITNQLHYLQRIGGGENRRPSFRNLGEIQLEGLPRDMAVTCYSKAIVCSQDGWNDLMISVNGPNIAVFKNKRRKVAKPEFVFSHLISAKDAPTFGYNFTELLTDRKTGERYFLDCEWGNWSTRGIKVRDGKVRLAAKTTPLDQNGPIYFEGETDPQAGKKGGGFHRAARWDFDRSGRQHLIVGTDKGLLYLLIEEQDLGTGGQFRFKSVGPLKDSSGRIIKVHNRVGAAAIDMDGDGLEDLVLVAATYQLGTKTDPNPGGGIYYLLNKGTGSDGLPRLATVQPLPVKGFEPKIEMQTGGHVQAVELDGEKHVIIATGQDEYRGRIYKRAKDGVALQYTGKFLDVYCSGSMLDVDGDGRLEIVFAGEEQGEGYYQRMLPENQKRLEK